MRLLSGKHTEAEVALLKKQTAELMTSYEEAEAQIRFNSPHYAAFTQPVPLSLKEVQQQLLDPDTVLLEFSLGEERSYLWAVTQTSFESFTLPPRQQIEAAARRVYELLTARNRTKKFEAAAERQRRIARSDSEYLSAAAALSEMVLAPVKERLGSSRLLVVSDGALHYVPFAALPDPKRSEHPPLMVNHEIINLPSALSLAVLRREIAGRRPAARTLAVLADPVFDKEDSRVRTSRDGRIKAGKAESQHEPSTPSFEGELMRSVREVDREGEGINIRRLQFTRHEANQIAALIPLSARLTALDFAASRKTATNPEMARYRYVHFATHGFLNSTHPELSGLVLSLVDETGANQDGFLRTYEVFNLKLPAEMVVLSGCRTGLGKEVRGEGLVGMTRGLMYAGAARVLVSLWDVSDEGSAELMTELYRQMLGREHLRPSAALRKAQIKIWKQKRWQSPYYWAAFVMQGEPR